MTPLLSRLRYLLPYAFLLFYGLGLAVSIAFQKYSYVINGTILAAPVLLASLIMIKWNRDQFSQSESSTLFQWSQKRSIVLFFCFFFIITTLLVGYGEQSLPLIALIAVTECIIAIQIFSRGISPLIILIEILLIAMVRIYSITQLVPFFIGYTDIIPHTVIIGITTLTGHVVPQDFSIYALFPLYHIFFTQNAILTGLSVKTALFLVACPIYSISILFVYLISRELRLNVQVSLLICLLLSMHSQYIYNGAYMVTKSLAFVGFIILLFLLYRIGNDNYENSGIAQPKGTSYHLLALILVMFIILVHHVSVLQILVILILLSLCRWFVGEGQNIKTLFLALFSVAFLTYWTYHASSIITDALLPRLAGSPVYSLNVMQSPHNVLGWDFFVQNLDILIFTFFVIAGIGYLIMSKNSKSATFFGIFVLLTFWLFLPTPLQSIWQLSQLLAFDRIVLFVLPCVVIVLGVGFYAIIDFSLRWKKDIRIPQIALVLVILLFSISSSGVFKDSRYTPREYFNESEIVGFEYIKNNVPSGSQLHADYPTEHYFNTKKLNASGNFSLPYYESNIIEDFERISSYRGYVIFPRDHFTSTGMFFGKGNELDPNNLQYIEPSGDSFRSISENCYSKNIIYTSERLEVFYDPDE